MGRQLPIDFVIKKLRKGLQKEEKFNKILCTEDHRIQITEEGNGNLWASIEHDLEPGVTWLYLESDEMEMDFNVQINEKNGKILRDKNVKAVNEMIKFTGDDTFVDTVLEKVLAFNTELLKA